MTRYWMTIAIPPPQRGKHCNTITTDTPAVPPVITTNVLSCVNGSYNPRTAIVIKIASFWSADEHCAVQLPQLKNLLYQHYIVNNQWKPRKYNKKYKSNVPAAWQLQPYKIHTFTIPHQGLLHGDRTVPVPSGKHPLLYCTPVLYHCTTHTGATTLHCTQRCRTTVLHTGDVHL